MYETDAFVADAERDVIAVTIPYRLGPFGFATFEGLEAEYNAGFLDQRMALKWVYDKLKHSEAITIASPSMGRAPAVRVLLLAYILSCQISISCRGGTGALLAVI